MTLKIRESIRKDVFALPPEDQFWLAGMIAGNVGYVLVPERRMYEIPTLEERVSKIEAIVRELNPGADL